MSLADRDWERGWVSYPDPAVESLDPRFDKYKLGSAAVERIWTGARWAEGPVWFGDGRFLLWSDIPNNRILRWCEESGAVTVFRSPSNYSNGHTRDRQGRLVSCEHGARRVTRTEYDGSITVLMDNFDDKRLNAPNDVVVHSDGSIWFTDPGYGILMNYEGYKADAELPTNVYRIDGATGEVTVVADDFVRPNGLCFSPDEKLLYIVDTGRSHQPDGPSHICAFRRDRRATPRQRPRSWTCHRAAATASAATWTAMSGPRRDGRATASTASTATHPTVHASARSTSPNRAPTSVSVVNGGIGFSWRPASRSTPCTWRRREPDDTGNWSQALRMYYEMNPPSPFFATTLPSSLYFHLMCQFSQNY
ncbi:MAG: SMP-30/gluconolactonase/LRE family protein [Caldilineaceae bacterium]